ncbi:NAD(P)-dependent alcohol dehydrogenase [Glycomyces sp. NPDC046736]|uniref:NAD(P)-dependent alcohol dehydrogenase n=1 Tax=Glycomyces sp. NPDC046736 TaxID=3155615 RepID=UPI0033D8EA03
MRAVLQDRYGTPDLVRVGDRERPVPGEGQVLIRVKAASLNGSDRENLAGSPFYARNNGLRRPRHPVPGSDVARIVEEAGASVTEFAPGDEVFGELAGYRGGLAEYVATPPKLLSRKPSELTFAEAAALPQAGCIALRATAGVQAGERVLVNGAGGAGGSLAIGFAKHFGAEVIAADRGDKADYLRSLGADETIDFATRDWAAGRAEYDRVIDLIGHRSPTRVHRALRPGGQYLLVGGHTRILLATAALGWALGRGKQVRVLVVPQSRADLEAVTALVTGGATKPVIDRVYPLEAAPEAFERLAACDNQGKIVIEIP